jgi:hypothetical protein
MLSIRRLVVLAIGIGVVAAAAAAGAPRGLQERDRSSPTVTGMPLLDPETSALVRQALTGSPKGFDALVTLARTMGFSIADDTLQVVQRPLAEPRLGLKVTLSELRAYHRMSLQGHSVRFSGVVDPFVFMLGKLGCQVDLRRAVIEGITSLVWSPSPAGRTAARVIVAIGLERGSNLLSASSGRDPVLDPLQYLFLVRDLSEEVCAMIRRAEASRPRIVPASLVSGGRRPRSGQDKGPPGFFEDGTNQGMGMVSSVVSGEIADSLAEHGGTRAFEKGGSMAAGAAVFLSLVKFMATYVCMEGDWTIENPPLVRTQLTGEDAETRKITCRLHWNVPALMQALKEWRTQINAVAGFVIDVDMPKNEALAYKRVEWSLKDGQFTRPDQFCVRFGTGIDATRQETDGNGNTSIALTGLRQRKALDPKRVQPYRRTVGLVLHAAVKDNKDGAQNIVDLAFGAGGLLPGAGLAPVVVLNQIFETVYRARWLPGAMTTVPVRDWTVPGSFTAALEFSAIGFGNVVINDSLDTRRMRRWWVGHRLQTVTMELRPAFPQSGRPRPETVAMLPPEIQAKLQRALDEQIFVAPDVLYAHAVNDRERDEMVDAQGCALPDKTSHAVADLFWQDSDDPAREDAEGRVVGWNVEQVLRQYPRRPAPTFNARLTVDIPAGRFKIEGSDVALLALATAEGTRAGAPAKTGLILVPLGPGEREPARDGHLVDAEGPLPQAVLDVLRDPRLAKPGVEYVFTVEESFDLWRVFDTARGPERHPVHVNRKWTFEFHPPVVPK